MKEEVTKNKNIKLVKCSVCKKAFYIRTKLKDKLKIKCPYCEQDVEVLINDENKNEAS